MIGFGSIARDARRHVGERIPLQEVTGVEQDDAAGIRGAHRVDDRRRPREPAHSLGLIRIVVPRPQTSVNVGRRGDDEIDGPGRSNVRWGNAGKEQSTETEGCVSHQFQSGGREVLSTPARAKLLTRSPLGHYATVTWMIPIRGTAETRVRQLCNELTAVLRCSQ